jgi:hypothetical protein
MYRVTVNATGNMVYGQLSGRGSSLAMSLKVPGLALGRAPASGRCTVKREGPFDSASQESLASALDDSVVNVVTLRTKEQMIGPNTPGDIAAVTDDEATGDFPEVQLPRKTVGALWATVDAQYSRREDRWYIRPRRSSPAKPQSVEPAVLEVEKTEPPPEPEPEPENGRILMRPDGQMYRVVRTLPDGSMELEKI